MRGGSGTAWPWRSVAITGASSGIGRALAEACAAPGVVLHLAGRDAGRLAAAAAACRARGAEVAATVLEVRDAAACARWIAGAGRIELLFANAGISGGTGGIGEPAAQARAIFETNLTGVLNTALPALEAMAAQPPGPDGVRGRIAVVASLAAFVAAPSAPAYCASKAAVQAWAEAMDGVERARGVRFHAVCPGYVRTPMTAHNPFPMPFLMDAEEAARRTLRGIARGRTRIAYPWPTYLGARLVGALPPRLRAAVFGRLPAKAASPGRE
ncbi:SDR family NAD(P)-dependent oxidoreductase [Caldovatus aquaticus]|uniref:SDR family NAD(P)-dependent oxidoreductase n=1 Tax=Caldovatus aquaticus TaxID=2865671 RepID=A0ABS7F5J3_9PROT|nr:SDR family NAD(P)-dependent oxidoreductase [Caldovatus aquaticus]MBW8270887.1 SDR family NAD(P)-dependent oxidoreductase [Caldovatus aquaticus]